MASSEKRRNHISTPTYFNGDIITVMSEKDDSSLVCDFRPIPLLNCTLKLLTKLIASRLRTIIKSIIINMALLTP
jgi:hypothetical protein